MQKFAYLIRTFRTMPPGRLFSVARLCAREHKRFTLFIVFDMLWCGVRYGAGPTDYRALRFAAAPARLRKTFVTRGINNAYIRKFNQRADYHKLENKIHFNQIFAEYLGRKWCDLTKINATDFCTFLNANNLKSIICKPVDKLCGTGIKKISLTAQTDINALYEQLKSEGLFLVEECLAQHDGMDKLYPHSVNTLRLVTIRTNDGVHIVYRGLRMGAGGNAVDNLNFGGVIVILDETGTSITHACNKLDEIFTHHPDTGVPMKGLRVPLFDEAEQLVTKAANVLPTMRYVGWDVAITQDCPFIIEGNHNPGHDTFQPASYLNEHDEGIRPRFTKIIEKFENNG
jgi:hypothetical protein